MVIVTGHVGRLVFGSLGGVDVVAMQGRVHVYESHNMWQVLLSYSSGIVRDGKGSLNFFLNFGFKI